MKFLDKTGLSYLWTKIQTALSKKADKNHTHSYAGSSSVGGAATSADKLNTNAGDANTPVYFANGVPKACTRLDLNTKGYHLASRPQKPIADLYKACPDMGSIPYFYGSEGTAYGLPENYCIVHITKGDTGRGEIIAHCLNSGRSYFKGTTTNNVLPSTWTEYATTATATSSTNGLMSASDKAKLNGIAAGANKYVHPTYTSKTSGLYKITVDGTGHVSGATAVTKSDITALGIPSTNTTYVAATSSINGLMTASDKTKLDGIAAGANKTVVDTALSTTSTNPVQNKVINAAFAGLYEDFAGKNHAHSDATTNSSGFMSGSDKAKLNGIAAGATKVVVDEYFSTTSKNPVQNDLITNRFNVLEEGVYSKEETNAAISTAIATNCLPLSGGTLTGDLTGQYITGTWLRTSSANHLGSAATSICVQNDGWVYTRTASELRSDIGAEAAGAANTALANAKAYTDSAISSAITTALNTQV